MKRQSNIFSTVGVVQILNFRGLGATRRKEKRRTKDNFIVMFMRFSCFDYQGAILAAALPGMQGEVPVFYLAWSMNLIQKSMSKHNFKKNVKQQDLLIELLQSTKC